MIEFGNVEVVGEVNSTFAKDDERAMHIRQEVVTTYDNDDDFGGVSFTKKPSYSSSRNMVVNIPSDMSDEEFGAKVKNLRIIRIMSNEPLLQKKHHWAIEKGLLDVDTVAKRQLIPTVVNGEVQYDNNGNVIPQLYLGRLQYRIFSLQPSSAKDIDYRDHSPVANYVSTSATINNSNTQDFDV